MGNPVNSYEFQIEEVKRDGYIAWDAIEVASKTRFPVNASEPYAAGSFPEITAYLKEQIVDFQVAYSELHKDSFNGATWRYVRGGTEVVVHDIPRTILRIGAFG